MSMYVLYSITQLSWSTLNRTKRLKFVLFAFSYVSQIDLKTNIIVVGKK